RLVIAAGAWSKPLVRQLGHSVPLETERGYHLNFAWRDGVVLNRPTLIGGENFVLCPMGDGIRLTGGVELASLQAPPDFRRIRALIPVAQRVLPGLSGDVTREWLGFRPSTPDSKPVIACSPTWPQVFFAFGHGHMGLSLSAITGRLIANLVAERASEIPLEPYAIDRF
ncbi:MAG: NAD(P)/FAD-dependent oxidoreductase, partial [Burkholderiales bacterium]